VEAWKGFQSHSSDYVLVSVLCVQVGCSIPFIVHRDVTNQVSDARPVQCQTCTYSPLYPAAQHHRLLTGTKLYCMTRTNVQTELFSETWSQTRDCEFDF